MYKLGLEFFNGTITTLATDRFRSAQTFTKLGAAQGINQAAQCVGAILIAPLVARFPTRTVSLAPFAPVALEARRCSGLTLESMLAGTRVRSRFLRLDDYPSAHH